MKHFKVLILFLFLTLNSCKENVENYIPHISGYWEIENVKNNNELLKNYTISTNIDFFIVNEDLSGFRKKVAPTLDGKYITTDDNIAFNLEVKDNILKIKYSKNDINFEETIVSASEEKLVITNDAGLIYTYKPYKPINIEANE